MNICSINGNIVQTPYLLENGKSIKLAVVATYMDSEETEKERASLVCCILVDPTDAQQQKLLSKSAQGMYIEFTGRICMMRYGIKGGDAVEMMDVVINRDSLLIHEVE